jgi:hypothetical protein
MQQTTDNAAGRIPPHFANVWTTSANEITYSVTTTMYVGV